MLICSRNTHSRHCRTTFYGQNMQCHLKAIMHVSYLVNIDRYCLINLSLIRSTPLTLPNHSIHLQLTSFNREMYVSFCGVTDLSVITYENTQHLGEISQELL